MYLDYTGLNNTFMTHHNSQSHYFSHGSENVQNSLTPPMTVITNSQQHQQQLPIHTNGNNEVVSSQSVSLNSSLSSVSMESTSAEVKDADELFDKIEDMICDYMREGNRHYLHCRVLRWSLENDTTRQFSAVVVINPPITKN
jgi:hypothetical protein